MSKKITKNAIKNAFSQRIVAHIFVKSKLNFMVGTKIKIINFRYSRDLIERLADLRSQAWGNSSLSNYQIPPIDELDEFSQHFVASDDDIIVAAARLTVLEKEMTTLHNEMIHLFKYSNRPILLSRLVTIPKARHEGIARRLTFERLAHIKANSCGSEVFAYVCLPCAGYYCKTYGFQMLEKTDQPYPNSGLVHLKFN